jgi:hypothetical protein
MRFDPESGAHAARQQQGYGAYSGPTGGAYGGSTGGGYGGPTGGGYGGPTGGAYGGPTGGSYGNGAASNGQAAPPAASSLKDCNAELLLERLPRMQRLMLRMLACVPEGAATQHPVCLVSAPCPVPPPCMSLACALRTPCARAEQEACTPARPLTAPPPPPRPAPAAQTASGWVLRESKAVYRAASEGVINLADKFFEMERSNALRCAGALVPCLVGARGSARTWQLASRPKSSARFAPAAPVPG